VNSEDKLLKILSEELAKSIDKDIIQTIASYTRHDRIKKILKNIKSFGLSAEERRVQEP
jgi:inhibitor of KinA sporulation pathway (predicted exonuclease)